MAPKLSEALAGLDLKPGQKERVPVNGYDVEIRRIPDEESDFPEAVALDLWLEIPESPTAKIVTATRGEPVLPPALEIDESDLAPE